MREPCLKRWTVWNPKVLPPPLWVPPFKLPPFTQLRVSRVISYILLPPVWFLLGCQEPPLEELWLTLPVFDLPVLPLSQQTTLFSIRARLCLDFVCLISMISDLLSLWIIKGWFTYPGNYSVDYFAVGIYILLFLFQFLFNKVTFFFLIDFLCIRVLSTIVSIFVLLRPPNSTEEKKTVVSRALQDV